MIFFKWSFFNFLLTRISFWSFKEFSPSSKAKLSKSTSYMINVAPGPFLCFKSSLVKIICQLYFCNHVDKILETAYRKASLTLFISVYELGFYVICKHLTCFVLKDSNIFCWEIWANLSELTSFYFPMKSLENLCFFEDFRKNSGYIIR